MTYQQFARLYDQLMEDAPYDMWVSFFRNAIDQYGIKDSTSVLDIGCGTGEISTRLAHEGFAVQGIDLSDEMLSIAREKADIQGLQIPFFQQDMRELEGFSEVDAALIFCDSLNYLRTEEDVRSTFERVSATLKDGGLLLFDVHTLYKMEEIFKDESFTMNGEEISYIWECHPGIEEGSVEHDLTFFVHIGDSVYKRYDETHYQVTYSREKYKELLNIAGFELLEVTSDFSSRKPSDTSERLFFIARKNA
ncbi:class I SAM-dependent DNA methyltransferase [Pseudalkalibacillus berkeleyi]|uniref:Class I SAM-dependent methyltransferase n=1 Tax=Pseudalkalibacillus berkeleyi TaxID=1069813 RepID=A0ABS9GZ79_9BACL|nr:class I SAM-dependent methyltransferase [Pseudalkalibacillus berkeleyi]MCF6137994.1 class I SAM-dependent methyltransferase [Pseudalkalibacillus berkeleyi]